jgi:uncharacterized protein
MTAAGLGLAALAAAAAGFVNALAGGGTLISFPTLTALGLPAVAANVTNSVALCPGYLGAAFAQTSDLTGQSGRLRTLLPAGAVGGLTGGLLLLATGDAAFRALVPYLILLAALLLAVQDPLRRWLERRRAATTGGLESVARAALPIGLAAVYGGYFGAGLSVIVLAVLGLLLDDTLTRLNALKQTIALAANVAAVLLFVFSGQVVWSVALWMAAGALAGGALGGWLAGSIRPRLLRRAVVGVGVAVAIVYLVR